MRIPGKVVTWVASVATAAALGVAGIVAIPNAFAAAAPCDPTVANWPDCLPTHAQMAAATRTQPNGAFFWTGGVMVQADEIARRFGGTTLEGGLERAELALPQMGTPRSTEGDAAWTFASRSLALQAVGIAFVIVGETPRPNNIWASEEFPTLQANPHVNCVIQVTGRTGDERVIWTRQGHSERQCRLERAIMMARMACPVWQQANWPRGVAGQNRLIEWPHDPSFRQGEVIYGGEPRASQTTRVLYSIAPTHVQPSPAEATRHVHATPVLEAYLPSGTATPEYFYLHLDAEEPADRRLTPEQIGCQPAHNIDELRKRNLRVLPLGDSITWGFSSSDGNGYRKPLLDKLAAAEASVDFVGSQRSGTMADADNEGYNGAVISEIDNYENAATVGYRPNVVLVHAGTNDMNRPADPDTAPDRLGRMIDDIVAHVPDAVVVVATIVPASNATVQSRITKYNAAIPAVVQKRVDAGKKVVLASMNNVTTGDLKDGLHPNDTGYAKMADTWRGALAQAAGKGWIQDPAAGQPGQPGCAEVAGRWIDRGLIASGVGAPSNKVRFADIDGDRRDDYLVLEPNGSVKAWMNTGGDASGKPGWVSRGEIASGAGLTNPNVHFADINGDNRDDYLVVELNRSVKAWINTGGDSAGKPGWAARGQIASGAVNVPGQVVFADVNGDNRDDYLIVAPDGGPVHAWLNAGGDTPQAPGWIARGQIAAGTKAFQVAFADFNCEPKDDYLTVDKDTGAVTAYVNTGGDTPTSPGWTARGRVAAGIPAAALSDITFADINGDGRDDYLLLGQSTGTVHAYLNNGGDPA